MSTADHVLQRLDRVRERGRGQWSARCPAHDDRGPSLSVKALDDGRILLHCFGGCSVDVVVGAIGLDLADLFPPRGPAGSGGRPSKLKLPASQALEILHREALTIFVVGYDMRQQRDLTEPNFQRLVAAVRRVGQIAEATQ